MLRDVLLTQSLHSQMNADDVAFIVVDLIHNRVFTVVPTRYKLVMESYVSVLFLLLAPHRVSSECFCLSD